MLDTFLYTDAELDHLAHLANVEWMMVRDPNVITTYEQAEEYARGYDPVFRPEMQEWLDGLRSGFEPGEAM